MTRTAGFCEMPTIRRCPDVRCRKSFRPPARTGGRRPREGCPREGCVPQWPSNRSGCALRTSVREWADKFTPATTSKRSLRSVRSATPMSPVPEPVSDYVRRVVRSAPRLTADDVQALREVVNAAPRAAQPATSADRGRVN